MKEKTYITICLLAITLGFYLLIHNFFMSQKIEVFNQMDLKLYTLEKQQAQEETKTDENINVEVEVNDVESDEIIEPIVDDREYIGTLKIPAISLYLGLVSPDSKYNNVDSNITIIQPSSMPDVSKGNLIIAGHSGTGYLAFFKNLYKLNIGDIASIDYQQKIYHYRLVKIYYETKSGYVSIYRNYDKKTLTLITCTKDDDTKQTIYIFEENI